MKNSLLTWKEKGSYMCCALGYELEMIIIFSYFTLFCTDVMNIDPTKIGIIMLITKVIDAFSDIAITNLADRTKSRFGKYRPWILFSGIPMAVFMCLCFWYPSFLQTQGQKLLWVFLVYAVTVGVFETGMMCSTVVMGTIISPNMYDRMDLAVARNLGENLGDIIVSIVLMSIVLAAGSYRDVRGWRIAASVFAVLIILFVITGFHGTRERVNVTNKDPDGRELSLRTKLKAIFGDKVFGKLLLLHCSFCFEWLLSLTLFNYFCIHNLGHEDWIAPLTTAGVVVEMGTTLLLSRLLRAHEKRTLITAGCGLIILSGVTLLLSRGFWTALLFQVLRGIGDGILFGCSWSYWPDATDYFQWKKGLALPGIVLATGSFCIKCTNAVSSYLSTWVLEIGGYDPLLETQSAHTLTVLRYGTGFCIVAACLFTMIVNSRLTELTKEKVLMYTQSGSSERRNHELSAS